MPMKDAHTRSDMTASEAHSPGVGFFTNLVGANRCVAGTAKTCTLARGSGDERRGQIGHLPPGPTRPGLRRQTRARSPATSPKVTEYRRTALSAPYDRPGEAGQAVLWCEHAGACAAADEGDGGGGTAGERGAGLA
jgi:hypothetical protein